MLIVESRVKTFFRLLLKWVKNILMGIGLIVFVVGSSLVLVDFHPPKNKEAINNLETRIEVLEKLHDIEEQSNE